MACHTHSVYFWNDKKSALAKWLYLPFQAYCRCQRLESTPLLTIRLCWAPSDNNVILGHGDDSVERNRILIVGFLILILHSDSAARHNWLNSKVCRSSENCDLHPSVFCILSKQSVSEVAYTAQVFATNETVLLRFHLHFTWQQHASAAETTNVCSRVPEWNL